MALLFIPAIALGLATLGGVIDIARAPAGIAKRDVAQHAFWSTCFGAGAIALASIAMGRPA